MDPTVPAWERTPAFAFDAATCRLSVLDQTRLPFETSWLQPASLADCVRVIRDMNVRGAPLIGLVAAAAMAMAARDDASDAALARAAVQLIGSRPTAVNLAWAVGRVSRALHEVPPRERAALAAQQVLSIRQIEYTRCERIAVHGSVLLAELALGDVVRRRGRLSVLTHCNAGWLATGAWGTALAPIYHLAATGVPIHVWVDETRPRNQGARLTTWELAQAGIPHTLIVDNCSASLMQRGEVDACLVGSDRTSSRGDVCNKIGTYQKALAAADNHLPFYVALPSSTIDWSIDDGVREIPIEERDPGEVLGFEGLDADGIVRTVHHSPPATAAFNFAFDVTPARLVDALICEHGVFGTTAQELERLRHVVAGSPDQL